MSNLPADFDAEKRRRWYAASFGAAGASVLMAIFFFRMLQEGIWSNPPGPAWQVAIVLFGIWLLFFLFKFVAAYALWYRPYASRRRAICLSLCATLAVYGCMFGGGFLFVGLRGTAFNFSSAFRSIWDFHLMIYGLPYLTAALIGWFFARPAPDVRDSF